MRNDLTDITLVVDRSGSMQACRSDAEGGVNAFIEEQKKATGEALFTLVQFDTEYEFVHKGCAMNDVPSYRLHPRGATALLDAVGRAIGETGDRLSAMDESQRPGLIVFVIVTDGHENSSREFKLAQIKEMIERQTNEYKWQFTFLGADASAFDDGPAMGVSLNAVAQYDPSNPSRAFAGTSSKIAQLRAACLAGQDASLSYTDEERQKMK